jgi:hypothetical protein
MRQLLSMVALAVATATWHPADAGSDDAQKSPSTAAAPTATRETAILAGGCFWGMEEILRKIPGVAELQMVRSVRVTVKNAPVMIVAIDVDSLGRRVSTSMRCPSWMVPRMCEVIRGGPVTECTSLLAQPCRTDSFFSQVCPGKVKGQYLRLTRPPMSVADELNVSNCRAVSKKTSRPFGGIAKPRKIEPLRATLHPKRRGAVWKNCRA